MQYSASGANLEPLGQRRRYPRGNEDSGKNDEGKYSTRGSSGGGRSIESGKVSPRPQSTSTTSNSRGSRWDRKSPTGSVGSANSVGRNERSRSRSRDRGRNQGSEYSSPRTPAEVSEDSNQAAASGAGGQRKRPRRSRWGDEKQKTAIPGMPTILPSSMTEEQRKAYVCQLQIEEITRKLRTGDYGIPPNPEDRSPSPEPVYDSHGKRLNTREVRMRTRLEHQRHHLVQEMLKTNANYKPPADYKPPQIKLSDKVWIPQDDHPEINFVGLLIGPRGNTLRQLERDTNTRIVIRGKGSVKEGKINKREGPLPGEDEPLHAFITATDAESIKNAVDKIKEVLDQALMVPEQQNELRKVQLRELAVLNGTLRGDELALAAGRCSNCGANTHKTWECPDRPNVTANIYCLNCGAAGHISKDCKVARGPGSVLDDEYSALMAELGQDTDGGGVPSGGKFASKMNMAKPGRGPLLGQPRWMPPPPPMMPPWGGGWQSHQSSTMGMPPMMPPPPPPPLTGDPDSGYGNWGGSMADMTSGGTSTSSKPPSLLSWTAMPPAAPTGGMPYYGMQAPMAVPPPPPPPPPPPLPPSSSFDEGNQSATMVKSDPPADYGYYMVPPPPPPPPTE